MKALINAKLMVLTFGLEGTVYMQTLPINRRQKTCVYWPMRVDTIDLAIYLGWHMQS